MTGGSHTRNRVFFLGGNDLEMVTIRGLLAGESSVSVVDKHLQWGAKASAYASEIGSCAAMGQTPVLVELENDLGVGGETAILVDHHGAQAGSDPPTSLEQVFSLLSLPASRWTRWHALVAANDRGSIDELIAFGASKEEIQTVRRAEWRAVGVTEEDAREARRGVEDADHTCAALTIVRLGHDRSTPAFDLLHESLGGPGYRNAVVLGPNEVNFSGDWSVVEALNQAFPGGWYGGRRPVRAFWGRNGAPDALVTWLGRRLCSPESPEAGTAAGDREPRKDGPARG